MIGQCRLCLEKAVKLCDSHFFPAALYRGLRGNPADGNPEPYLITSTGALRTSKQLKAHLLCGGCEERFNKYGESWVFKNGMKANSSFPLASALAKQQPASSDPNIANTKLYFAEDIAALNVSALAYFGASIFWRASIYPWNTDCTIPIKLGQYQEDFRSYLLGQSVFPEHSSLMIIVREALETSHLTYFPYSIKVSGIRYHQFVMPGFAFTLVVGKDIPEKLQALCIVRGSHNPILVTANIEQSLLDMGVKMLERSQHGRK